jgi:hypothetical protein
MNALLVLGLLVGLDQQTTRYGTTHRMLTVSTFDVVGELDVADRAALIVRAPFAGTKLSDEGCCLVHSGNLTAGARWRQAGERTGLAIESSVSLPTTMGSDGYTRLNTRYAATAELFRDAGRFLPETTTLRLGGSGFVRVGERAALFGGLALHDWSRDREHELVVPMTIGAGCRIGAGLEASAALLTLAHPGEEETFLHAVETTAGWRGGGWMVTARLDVPLDESLRRLGMIGGGVSVARSF